MSEIIKTQNKDNHGNPYHKGKGPGGGQFASADGQNSSSPAPRYRKQIDNPYSYAVEELGLTVLDDRGADGSPRLEAYNEAALKSIIEDTGMDFRDAYIFHQAVVEYFGGDYKAFTTGKRKKETKIIDDGLEKMPKYDGETFRGLSFDMSHEKNDPVRHQENLKRYENLMNQLSVGQTFSPNVISSWTDQKSIGQDYANLESPTDQSVMFWVKKNKSGVGMKHISKFGDLESEVLYPSTSKFRVISHMKVPKTANPKLKLHIVVLEEV